MTLLAARSNLNGDTPLTEPGPGPGAALAKPALSDTVTVTARATPLTVTESLSITGTGRMMIIMASGPPHLPLAAWLSRRRSR